MLKNTTLLQNILGDGNNFDIFASLFKNTVCGHN